MLSFGIDYLDFERKKKNCLTYKKGSGGQDPIDLAFIINTIDRLNLFLSDVIVKWFFSQFTTLD